MKLFIFVELDEINKDYRNIWKKYINKFGCNSEEFNKARLNRWPLQYPSKCMTNKDLLFVGFNPAFDNKNELLKLDCEKIKEGVLVDVNILRKILNQEKKALSCIDKGEEDRKEHTANSSDCNDVKSYPYYDIFKKISKDISGDCYNWAHIDILPMRETSQDKLKKDLGLNKENLFDPSTNDKYRELIKELLDIFFKAVKLANPKLIIVVNGYVSKSIIRMTGSPYESIRNMEAQNEKSESKYTDYFREKIKIGPNPQDDIFVARSIKLETKSYPLILSGMLTGKHALDLGSRERLVDHIKHIYNI